MTELLVWVGAALTIIGLVMIGYCIVSAMRARRAGLEDEALRQRLQRVVFLNMLALLISAIGLMSVVLGVFLSP